nr:radical SAM protein [Candidatus Baldrarchaeota archaeon]
VSIKAFSYQVHKYYTGKSNRRVLRNFKSIYENAPEKLSAETVLIPGLVDIDEIERIAKFISSIDPTIPLRIDCYWPVVPNTPWRAPTREEIRSAVISARKYLENVHFLSSDAKVIGKVHNLWPIE